MISAASFLIAYGTLSRSSRLFLLRGDSGSLAWALLCAERFDPIEPDQARTAES